MRGWLIRLLKAALLWLEPPTSAPVPRGSYGLLVLPVPMDALFILARRLTQAQQWDYPDRSGESKRHQVYAALIKAFPERTHRSIARAIEAALEA